jgi:hypothetical protein
MKSLEVDAQTYEDIAKLIGSTESPVGIDAKKTHIIIINKLNEINERMIRIEQMLTEKK